MIDSYYKVSVKTYADVSDEDTFRGPSVPVVRTRDVAREALPDMHRVTNWLFPFDSSDEGATQRARDAADAKRRQVLTRLPKDEHDRVRLFRWSRTHRLPVAA